MSSDHEIIRSAYSEHIVDCLFICGITVHCTVCGLKVKLRSY